MFERSELAAETAPRSTDGRGDLTGMLDIAVFEGSVEETMYDSVGGSAGHRIFVGQQSDKALDGARVAQPSQRRRRTATHSARRVRERTQQSRCRTTIPENTKVRGCIASYSLVIVMRARSRVASSSRSRPPASLRSRS